MTASLAAALALVPAQGAQDTEIPFQITEHAIIAHATVNGKPVSCMFDTGFSGSFVIGPHIDLGKPTGKMNLKDFVGVFEANTIKVTELQLGPLKAQHDGMEVVQMPTLDFTQSYGTHVDGIMGLEVFAPYVTEINFEKGVFIVHPPSHDVSKFTPDNKRTFLAKMLPIGNNSIEMAVRAPSGKQMVLALDTGNAFYATTHRDVLERVGLWTPGKEPKFVGASQVASGVVESWSILIEGAQIYGVPIESAVWDIIDLPSSTAQHDGTIGFGFLKHFNITMDLQRRRVWLENFTGRYTDEPVGEVGIAATYHPGRQRMVVVFVTPHSPADRAGIKEGDYLVSVGEETLVKSSYRHVRGLLEGKPDTEIEVGVSAGGQLKRIKLKRELLVNQVG
jgi:hypothetical protein